MKSIKRAGLVVGLLAFGSPAAFGGDHFRWHGGTTTMTTTAVVAPAVLAPAAYGVVQPVAVQAVAPAAYYYYVATVPQAAAVAPMAAPSLLNATALATAAPQATGRGGVAGYSAAGVANVVKARILQGLREFAAANNVDRATMTAALRQVGLGLLRAELNQWGLGFLVPGQADQNILEELVEQVVRERFDGGSAGLGGTGAAPPSFVFQGPVTLSFPNVQSVRIQTPDVRQSGTTGGDGGATDSDSSIPSLGAAAAVPASETPVPPNPVVPKNE